MKEYLGSARFFGSGAKVEKGSYGITHRWQINNELWELSVWKDRRAIRGDEDEAPVILKVNGEPTEEFGSIEEFNRKYPLLSADID